MCHYVLLMIYIFPIELTLHKCLYSTINRFDLFVILLLFFRLSLLRTHIWLAFVTFREGTLTVKFSYAVS